MENNAIKIIPVIISGGVGKRLWPLSRESFPKPYLKLYNAKSLLQNTVLRCQEIPFLDKPIVIANSKNKFIIQSQLKDVNADDSILILEPECHNTAPSIAIAVQYIKHNTPSLMSAGTAGNALLLIMPVDHKIDDLEGLQRSIQLAIPAVEQGNMVIFGVKPTFPHTGYGYIEVKETAGQGDIYHVNAFKEKPDELHAKQFIADGHYFWNAGFYFIGADRLIRDFKQHEPMMFSECERALLHSHYKDNIIELPSNAYLNCPSISIDYAITENTTNILMVELQSDWHDIGNWQVLYDLDRKDADGNVIHGNVVAVETKNSYIRTENHKLILAMGIKNCCIIETCDAILIADNKHLDKLPDTLELMQKDGRSEATIATTVFKPWGFYTAIQTSVNLQIKKIVVYPHQSLSLQEHQYRSEHWIILKGKATVTIGHEVSVVHYNESIFVPIGMRHRLENKEESPLEIIEIQTGSYLGEDDIKRYEDLYERESVKA